MRLPKNRLIRFALYAVSAVIILIAVDLLFIRLCARVHPGPATTVLTTPTLPDGRVDYLAALDATFAGGVTRDNNAAIPFIRAFGTQKVLLQRYRQPVSAALGLSPTPDDAHFVEFDGYFNAQHQGAKVSPPDIDSLADHPWRAEEHPDVAAWLRHNAPYLDLLHDASLRPRYYYPYNVGPRPDVLLGLLLPDMNFAAYTIHTILTRAMLRVETGDAAGAVEDLMTARRFVALFSQSPIGVAHNVANHGDMVVSRAARALATRLSAADLRTLAEALDRLPPLAPIAGVYDRQERFMYLDSLQYVSRQNPKQAIWSLSTFVYPPSHSDDWSLIVRCCLPIDYDAHMRAINGFFDRLVGALNEPAYPARQAALTGWKASAGSLPFLLRTAAFLPEANVDRMLGPARSFDAANAQRALTRVAVALAQHKLDSGRYPNSLADLSPKYLSQVPVDPYTLKPFFYNVTPTGYTLSSAGPNMVDDGGRGDDLVASVS